MFLQHGNNQIQWEIQFMIINDNIDFVTVIYKRLDYAKLIHESIINMLIILIHSMLLIMVIMQMIVLN